MDSTFNDNHQLTNDKNFSYTYDNNGNLTKRVNLSTNEVMELDWDYENRLTQVVKRPSEGATPTGIFSYKYDAFDRRIQKNINGEITSYIYDRENILLEYDGDGNLKAKYIHNTSAIDDILVMEREDTPYRNEAYPKQEFYFHKDRLGNITEVTDYVGVVVQRYVYDAFGAITIFDKDGNEITPNSPTYLENPYTFTGREYDPETGFYYYRARYYDPSSGRFLSEDPIGFAGGDFNLYRYVFNSPVNLIDPMGTDAYLASRDIVYKGINIQASHNFIVVTNSSGTRTFSFGLQRDGQLGLIRAGRGVGLEDTAKIDAASFAEGTAVLQRIHAPDSVVVETALGILPTNRYFFLGINSNSAAQAVANIAQGSPVSTPSSSFFGAVGSGYQDRIVGLCGVR